jgi:hypothetical protein
LKFVYDVTFIRNVEFGAQLTPTQGAGCASSFEDVSKKETPQKLCRKR